MQRDPNHGPRLDRRQFTRGALLGGLGGALSASPGHALSLAGLAPAPMKAQHIVLVAFAGGVRTRETFGSTDNVPNMKALAEEGVLYRRARTGNLGHFGATLSIFTGISEARGIRENSRGSDPTLFEYIRKDTGLPASQVWITTSGGAQQVNYAYGNHAEYGARYGANTLDGDGIFNKEFKELLQRYGKPKELGEREASALLDMRRALGGKSDGTNSSESSAAVEQYILDELTRGTTDLRGVNAGDAKALRVARNLITFFRPRLTAVVLQNADIAHGSFNGYAEVVRRNDAMIGEIVQSVRADPGLAESTAIFVLPEFGRDSDLNSRRGLDHGDGSDDLNYVSCLAWGPDFKRGRVVDEDVRTIDVVPTICHMMGAEAKLARGKRLPKLFA